MRIILEQQRWIMNARAAAEEQLNTLRHLREELPQGSDARRTIAQAVVEQSAVVATLEAAEASHCAELAES